MNEEDKESVCSDRVDGRLDTVDCLSRTAQAPEGQQDGTSKRGLRHALCLLQAYSKEVSQTSQQLAQDHSRFCDQLSVLIANGQIKNKEVCEHYKQRLAEIYEQTKQQIKSNNEGAMRRLISLVTKCEALLKKQAKLSEHEMCVFSSHCWEIREWIKLNPNASNYNCDLKEKDILSIYQSIIQKMQQDSKEELVNLLNMIEEKLKNEDSTYKELVELKNECQRTREKIEHIESCEEFDEMRTLLEKQREAILDRLTEKNKIAKKDLKLLLNRIEEDIKKEFSTDRELKELKTLCKKTREKLTSPQMQTYEEFNGIRADLEKQRKSVFDRLNEENKNAKKSEYDLKTKAVEALCRQFNNELMQISSKDQCDSYKSMLFNIQNEMNADAMEQGNQALKESNLQRIKEREYVLYVSDAYDYFKDIDEDRFLPENKRVILRNCKEEITWISENENASASIINSRIKIFEEFVAKTFERLKQEDKVARDELNKLTHNVVTRIKNNMVSENVDMAILHSECIDVKDWIFKNPNASKTVCEAQISKLQKIEKDFDTLQSQHRERPYNITDYQDPKSYGKSVGVMQPVNDGIFDFYSLQRGSVSQLRGNEAPIHEVSHSYGPNMGLISNKQKVVCPQPTSRLNPEGQFRIGGQRMTTPKRPTSRKQIDEAIDDLKCYAKDIKANVGVIASLSSSERGQLAGMCSDVFIWVADKKTRTLSDIERKKKKLKDRYETCVIQSRGPANLISHFVA